MYVYLPQIFNKFFPYIAKYVARRRQRLYAEYILRQRQARYLRPFLEGLEDRVVLDAYTFVNPLTGLPSVGVYSVGANWTDTTNAGGNGQVPKATDTVEIPVNAVCTVDIPVTVQSVAVEGTLDVNSNLSVVGLTGFPGDVEVLSGGIMNTADNTTVSACFLGISGILNDNAEIDITDNGTTDAGTTIVTNGGVFRIGSPNDMAGEAKLTTETLTDNGTVNVGGVAGGDTGIIDAVFANLGTSGNSGLLNLGDPDGGMSGDMNVSDTATLNGGTVNVGSSGGVAGKLDVNNLTSSAIVNVNDGGEVDVMNSANFGGNTTITGKVTADTGGAFGGAGVTLGGTGSISGGGKLTAEINASFTFGLGCNWAINAGNVVGTALNEGLFNVNGTVAINTALDPNGDLALNDDGGQTSAGSIVGSGSLDLSHDFTWNGGTVGLTGGVSVGPQGDFKLAGGDAKTLDTDVENLSLHSELGGTGGLSITAGNTFTNEITSILAVSLPTIGGPGTFDNFATMSVSSPTGLTISSIFKNEDSGVIDCETAAGPLELSDTSGSSLLNGKLSLNDDSLLLSGDFSTTGFDEEWSPTDLTTLTGSLDVAGGSADFDHVILAYNGYSGGGTITGAGDFSIGDSGLNTGDYLDWQDGTMSGSGKTTIGTYATLNLTGFGSEGRELDNEGTVNWPQDAEFSFDSGTVVNNEKGGLFDYDGMGGSITTFTNDGTLELGSDSYSPLTITTFTQTSTGTLQSDLASGSAFGGLSVTGAATLDGTLQAQLENGYQPPSGSDFEVLTFGSSSGSFATIQPDGWQAQYDTNDVTLVSA